MDDRAPFRTYALLDASDARTSHRVMLVVLVLGVILGGFITSMP